MKSLLSWLVLIVSIAVLVSSCAKKDSSSSSTDNTTTTTTSIVSFVAVGNSGTILTSSDNGTSWTSRTSGTTNNLRRVIYENELFGLLEQSKDDTGIQDYILKSDGSGGEMLCLKTGGSLKPASHETIKNKEHYIYQEGSSVFKFAVTNMADISEEIMKKNNQKIVIKKLLLKK